jgi:transposase InsO family protein
MSPRCTPRIDLFRRECVALVVQRQFRETDVARVLAAAGAARRLPGIIQCDQGTEFTSVTLDHWAAAIQ